MTTQSAKERVDYDALRAAYEAQKAEIAALLADQVKLEHIALHHQDARALYERRVAELEAQLDALKNENDRNKAAKDSAIVRAESLARTVMSDQVSNDCVVGDLKDEFITVWKVTRPSGESCYCGVESVAKAIAQKTGVVDIVRLPRRDFKLVDLSDKQHHQKERAIYSDKLDFAMAALKRYGRHTQACFITDIDDRDKCTCGFDEALKGTK